MVSPSLLGIVLLLSISRGGLSSDKDEDEAEGLMSPIGQDGKYPSKRMTLKELNYCDLGWSGMKHSSPYDPNVKYEGAVECPPRWKFFEKPEDKPPNDPTCLSCLKNRTLQYAESVWDRYSNQKSQQERRDMFSRWFRQTPCDNPTDVTCGKVAVVVAADEKYVHMLAHWWCNAHRQGLDPHQLVVLAFDQKTKTWADQNGLLAVELKLYGIQGMPVTFSFKWATFPIFLDLMAIGMHVLFNDVDIVWTKNMAARLPRYFVGRDLVTALAPRSNYVGLNSGVLSMRATSEMVVFVETLMSAIPLFMTADFGAGGDQNIWNNLLRHYIFRSLTWLPLPHNFIVRNGARDLYYSEETTLAIHFVGGNKNEKIEEKLKNFADVFDASPCLAELQ